MVVVVVVFNRVRALSNHIKLNISLKSVSVDIRD